MKCKNCGREFETIETKHGKPYDRGDGVVYSNSIYSRKKPICPYCGFDNSPKVILKDEKSKM